MSLRRTRLRSPVAATLALLLALALAALSAGPAGAAPAGHRHHHRVARGCRHRHHGRRRCVRHAAHRKVPATLRTHRTVAVVTVDAAQPPAVTPPAVPAVCPDTQLVPDSTNLDRIAAATTCLVNQQRVAAGLVALADDGPLYRAALEHTQDMTTRGYFDHVSPTGETPLDRVQASGYLTPGAGYEVGENLAGCTGSEGTPATIVAAWMQSPEHRANILNPDYRQSGMAVIAAAPTSSPQPGATYTQEFGVLTYG